MNNWFAFVFGFSLSIPGILVVLLKSNANERHIRNELRKLKEASEERDRELAEFVQGSNIRRTAEPTGSYPTESHPG